MRNEHLDVVSITQGSSLYPNSRERRIEYEIVVASQEWRFLIRIIKFHLEERRPPFFVTRPATLFCIAFMAMKFGDATLDRAVETCFKPAVARTGFELRKLTDQQPAGLIDDQIRAALLSGRFVIADLTHGSHGAYWEAGYAEGLGLPVIYTCEKSAWEKSKTHFDTNHMLTIIWEESQLAKAGSADPGNPSYRSKAGRLVHPSESFDSSDDGEF